MSTLNLRAWQAAFLDRLCAHTAPDFLLVACPAAGKTIAAAAAAAKLMAAEDSDQLVVVAPTVVVRDQWATVLSELGFRMSTDFPARDGWPDWQHGVVGTYAQVAQRADTYAAMCERRRTVVVMDEVHHAGEQLTWGDGLARAFAPAARRLLLSGTPFRSDRERIPFLTYDDTGSCVPDFAYGYPQAVRDGVCRSIEFHAHDGVITWEENGRDVTATFSQNVAARTRRLRASLDPSQPYLEELLRHAHADLQQLRADGAPAAAGLVVCDSQPHAQAIDQLLERITGNVPVLATSDVPRAHQAIRAFADDDIEWLVSVRMVAEGVDIPRIGVIAWATTASTELMLRQVAGRALRGSTEHPAIVHMPADPVLVDHAGRLDRLGGMTLRPRSNEISDTAKQRAAALAKERRSAASAAARARFIDPRPFVEWFDRHAEFEGVERVALRCGLNPESVARRINGWRRGEHAQLFTLLDICHLADVDFFEMFDGPEYAEARSIAAGDGSIVNPIGWAVEAHPIDHQPKAITIAAGETRAPVQPVPAPLDVTTPELPPSPEDLAAAAEQRARDRADLFRLLGTYTQLRRAVQPGYQFAAASIELAQAIGQPVSPDSDDETIAAAAAWIQERTAAFARQHPAKLRELARAQRRLRIQAERQAA